MANTLIIIIVIVKALNLVRKFPIGPFINPLTINNIPDPTSDIATTDDKSGDKPKYSINPAGGKGNLKYPCIINATPRPNLKNQGAIKFNLLNKFSIIYLLWEPSQNGWFLVCLQAQKNNFFVTSALKAIGLNSVPLCEPSHNGCFKLFPQLHQK